MGASALLAPWLSCSAGDCAQALAGEGIRPPQNVATAALGSLAQEHPRQESPGHVGVNTLGTPVS